MRIVVTSVYVDHQQKALDFYTDKLGFVKERDIPMGESHELRLHPASAMSRVSQGTGIHRDLVGSRDLS